MAGISHLTNRRGGIWYYERRVPTAVQMRPDQWQHLFGRKAFYRKSLFTKHHVMALERGLEAERAFDELVAEALGRPTLGMPPASSAVVTEEARVPDPSELAVLAAEYRKSIVDPWRVRSVRADIDSAHGEQFGIDSERYKLSRETRLEAINSRTIGPAMPDGDAHPVEAAQRINSERGFYLPEQSSTFGVLVSYLRQASVEADKDVMRVIAGEAVSSADTSPLMARADEANRILARRSPTISEIIQRYVHAGGLNGKLAGTTVTAIRQAEREFIAFAGDIQVHKIDRPLVRGFIASLASTDVGGKFAGSIRRPAAKGTVQKKLTFLRSPVDLAIEQDFFDGANPFVNTRLNGVVRGADPRLMPDKRAFTTGELAKLFQHPWFAGCLGTSGIDCNKPGPILLNDMRFWAPIVGMFTGCRAAELGGLRLCEVLLNDTHPHFVIRDNAYRPTKKGKEKRVPIMDDLLKLGFAEYVARIQKSGADRLFPDWVAQGTSSSGQARWATAKWIKRFNDTVVPTALKGALSEDARRAVSFHSLRGSFKKLLERGHLRQQYVDDIIGHTKHELDRAYSGITAIDVLYSEARALSYEGLTLPAARS